MILFAQMLDAVPDERPFPAYVSSVTPRFLQRFAAWQREQKPAV